MRRAATLGGLLDRTRAPEGRQVPPPEAEEGVQLVRTAAQVEWPVTAVRTAAQVERPVMTAAQVEHLDPPALAWGEPGALIHANRGAQPHVAPIRANQQQTQASPLGNFCAVMARAPARWFAALQSRIALQGMVAYPICTVGSGVEKVAPIVQRVIASLHQRERYILEPSK